MTLEEIKNAAKVGLLSLLRYQLSAHANSFSLGRDALSLGVGDSTELSSIQTAMQVSYDNYISWSASVDALATNKEVSDFFKAKISGTGYWELLKGALEVNLGSEA